MEDQVDERAPLVSRNSSGETRRRMEDRMDERARPVSRDSFGEMRHNIEDQVDERAPLVSKKFSGQMSRNGKEIQLDERTQPNSKNSKSGRRIQMHPSGKSPFKRNTLYDVSDSVCYVHLLLFARKIEKVLALFTF